MNEEWKLIEGASRYSVSNQGQVVSRCYAPERQKKLSVQGSGYFQCEIWNDDGSHYKPLVHRLVATAFIPNPDELPEVNHLDGNKLNNRVSNLEWCSRSSNQLHAFATGLSKPRPRILSDAQKAELLSGATVKAFCRKHRIACVTARRLRDEIGAPVFRQESKRADANLVALVMSHPGSVRRCARDLGIGKSLVHSIRSENSRAGAAP